MNNMLSPQEKAKELVEKMMLYSLEKEDYIDDFPKYTVNYKIKKEYAKQCALIAIEEMKEVYAVALYALLGLTKEEAKSRESKYLLEVKQEIEKL
jgi:hypothetical protein